MSPLSPMTTPEPSRSRPSIAALRASGTAWTETLTMAAKSLEGSAPAAALASLPGFFALASACAAGVATRRQSARLAVNKPTNFRDHRGAGGGGGGHVRPSMGHAVGGETQL